ncbi:ABC transporter permease [Actinomadura napierensis]|uniref:ABC transporter permease n=1 Tax=Actinomadura napierensis TaxID=267854 RepID=A0ABP5JK49_9ACTN
MTGRTGASLEARDPTDPADHLAGDRPSDRGAARPKRRARVLLTGLARTAPIIAVVAGWELAARGADDPYFPPPAQIATRLRQLWFSGPSDRVWLTQQAIENVPPSLARLLGAWLLAAAGGIAAGVLLGRLRLLADLLEPAIHFARAVPPPAVLPVWLALLHIGSPMQVATIVFGVIWPVLLAAIDGARAVQPAQEDIARVFHLSGPQRLIYLILPAALPKIFAGLRLSLSLSLILMVVSELMGGATNGIGFSLLLEPQRTYDIPAMWVGIVVLGVLGFAFNAALLAVERRVLARHGRAHQKI